MSTNEKRIKSRSIQKHDLEVNWLKATTFIPYKGELIIYDIEVDEEGNTLKDTAENLLLPAGRTTPYTYERVKIGDGINAVSELPFVDTTALKYIEQELTEAQKVQARENIGVPAIGNNILNGALLIYDTQTKQIIDSGFTIKTFYDKILADIKTWIATTEHIEDNDAGGQTAMYSAPPESVASVANEQGGDTLMIGGIE